MKRAKYISYLLLIIFATTSLFHLTVDLACSCSKECHGSDYMCIHLHHHNSNCEGKECDDNNSCFHYQVKEFVAETPSHSNFNIAPSSILINYLATLVANFEITEVDLEQINSKPRYLDSDIEISSQWHTPALRRRPPPTQSVLL